MNEENNVEKTEIVEKAAEVKTYQYVYGIAFKKALQTYFFGYDDPSLTLNTKVVVTSCEPSLLFEAFHGLK